MAKYREDYFKLPLWIDNVFKAYSDKEIGRAFNAVMNYYFYHEMPDISGKSFDLFLILKRIADYQRQHPKWLGGPIDDNAAIRNSREYREWRDAVFMRDNYTCQMCGRRGGNINAHHIKHFAKYPELRLSLENGITLCKNCHREAHRNAEQNSEREHLHQRQP